MNINKVTVSLFLDTRRSIQKGGFPVKLSLYFLGSKKRFRTGIVVTSETWEQVHQRTIRDHSIKLLRRKLNLLKEKAEQIIENMESFSYPAFEALYFPKRESKKPTSLRDLFEEYIVSLESKGRIGTASSYKSTKNSLFHYQPKLQLSDVTVDFLEAYEQHMRANNASPSTIGIYLRQLRCLINIAINKGLFPADQYPFKKYTIPSARNIKKSLNSQQLKALLHFVPKTKEQQQALDFWLFSYLCNGINMTDICYLKPENLQGDYFYFFRAKTKHTKKRDLRPIKVPLVERSKSIIATWRNTDPTNPFLFPILKEGLTPKQEKYRIQGFIKKVNKQMKEVAAALHIENCIGTYVARHSHSTMLKRLGVSTEVIMENLGHSSMATTENYLDDFPDDVKMGYATQLMNL